MDDEAAYRKLLRTVIRSEELIDALIDYYGLALSKVIIRYGYKGVRPRQEIERIVAALACVPLSRRRFCIVDAGEEVAWLNAEVGRDLVEPPGADPVRSLLVLLDLRECKAEVAAQSPLTDAERLPALPHPQSDMSVDFTR